MLGRGRAGFPRAYRTLARVRASADMLVGRVSIDAVPPRTSGCLRRSLVSVSLPYRRQNETRSCFPPELPHPQLTLLAHLDCLLDARLRYSQRGPNHQPPPREFDHASRVSCRHCTPPNSAHPRGRPRRSFGNRSAPRVMLMLSPLKSPNCLASGGRERCVPSGRPGCPAHGHEADDGARLEAARGSACSAHDPEACFNIGARVPSLEA
jgi:hypothetical protein